MMQLIQMPRGYGKSTVLINLMARDDDSVCIVVNQQMAEYMAELLIFSRFALGLSVLKLTPKEVAETRFSTPNRWGTTGRMRKPKRVYVDDLDIVLQQLLGVGIDIATYSPPQEWSNP